MRVNFLEGRRIALRPITSKKYFLKYISWIHDQEVTRYMGSGKFPSSMQGLKKYILDYQKDKTGMILGVFVKKGSRYIGNVTLHQISWKDRHGEIGIMIGDKTQWGKGYATEALKILANHAFNKLNLNKIYCGMISGNKSSKRAFEKVGFKVEGTLKEHFYLDGKYQDCYRLGLLRRNYKG